MAWTTPITSNNPANKVTITTFDNIGANQVYLKERADVVDDRLGQSVNTSDDVAFNKVTSPTGAITTVNATTGNITTVNSESINNNGSINSESINTGNVDTQEYLFEGALSSNGLASFTHGLDQSKVIGATGIIYSAIFSTYSWFSDEDTKVQVGDTECIITNTSGAYSSDTYRVLIKCKI